MFSAYHLIEIYLCLYVQSIVYSLVPLTLVWFNATPSRASSALARQQCPHHLHMPHRRQLFSFDALCRDADTSSTSENFCIFRKNY